MEMKIQKALVNDLLRKPCKRTNIETFTIVIMSARNARTPASQIVSLTDSLPSDGNVDDKASEGVVDKAKELIMVLQTPMDHISSLMSGMAESAVSSTLMRFGVFDTLPAPPASITAENFGGEDGSASIFTRTIAPSVGWNGIYPESGGRPRRFRVRAHLDFPGIPCRLSDEGSWSTV